jgi:multidrug efflux system outer membrane protein
MKGYKANTSVAILSAYFILSLIPACAPVGPNYKKPEIQTPDVWHEAVAKQVSQTSNASLQTWWKVFDDPILNDLIEQARISNLDVQIAVARIRESRARLGIADGDLMPVANAEVSAYEFKHSDNGQLQQLAPPNGFHSQSLFTLGGDALWEMDVFGRIRRQIEASGAEYEASIEDYRDVLVTLFAEIALAYVEIRSYQQRIIFTKANATTQRGMLRLTRDRYESGIGSKLDTVQALSNLANTEAAVPPLEIGLHSTLNRLAVLLGQSAGSLHEKLSKPMPIPSPKEGIGMGVPADILRQRPDIRQAEKKLAANTAMIGVTTADLYPRFALTGFFGFQTSSFSDMGNWGSMAWGLKLPVQWNIFNGGRTRNRITVREEIVQQDLLAYQNTVLNAIEEVENAVVARNQEQIRQTWLQEAVDATQEAVNLVVVQYNTGLTDFNNVLDTQRTLFRQQDKLVDSQGKTVLNLIKLYKALGGGWTIETPKDRDHSASPPRASEPPDKGGHPAGETQ